MVLTHFHLGMLSSLPLEHEADQRRDPSSHCLLASLIHKACADKSSGVQSPILSLYSQGA